MIKSPTVSTKRKDNIRIDVKVNIAYVMAEKFLGSRERP